MSLFNFGKKMDLSCCYIAESSIKSITVLGSGCKACHALHESCKEAVAELGINIEVEYVTDMEKIISYGVMSTPALVINEKVVSMGKVLKKEDIIKLLKK
jgi:small redox-active disulfide protein 2